MEDVTVYFNKAHVQIPWNLVFTLTNVKLSVAVPPEQLNGHEMQDVTHSTSEVHVKLDDSSPQ
jgi:hypothetical protein